MFSNLSEFLSEIADAIREKKGTEDSINAQDFADEIRNLPTGGDSTLKKLLDATKSTERLFYNYKGTSVNSLISYNDTSNVEIMTYTFYGCSNLTTIPQLDTSNVVKMPYTFRGCSNLTTIPQLNASNVTVMTSTFFGCASLKSILMYGMKVSFDISASTQFEREDLVTILNNLATVPTSQTLTMGSKNLAKLTDEDKAIAINKGWTLA